ncbi:hypothetical protein TNCV_2335791 [Trichonephila clavipes]|uniref:Uncharacterized protein n=1 Tax=Trichonephila clavipes TaxID=2585209 RepID=A0A8X6SKR5_TRICX|nr:hypothetical protein TNCV_2335791 [Trichonephila clavipes]
MPDSVNAAVPVGPKAPRSLHPPLSLLTTTTRLCRRSRESGLNQVKKLSGIPEDTCSTRTSTARSLPSLKKKGEEFHAIDPIEVRPQKIVIKGLPISTDINAIRDDLTERGFNVIKVAQLT